MMKVCAFLRVWCFLADKTPSPTEMGVDGEEQTAPILHRMGQQQSLFAHLRAKSSQSLLGRGEEQ